MSDEFAQPAYLKRMLNLCAENAATYAAHHALLITHYFFFLLLLTACVAAPPAPDTAIDPAAVYTFDGATFRNRDFAMEPPPGWQVIAGEADAPPSAILVAPDDCALFRVSASPLTSDDAPALPDSCGVSQADARAMLPADGDRPAVAAAWRTSDPAVTALIDASLATVRRAP